MAMEYYSNALKIARSAGDQEAAWRCLGNMAIVQDAKGNYQKALDYYQEALAESRKKNRRESMQVNLSNIGITYSHMHEYSKALQCHMQALDISRNMGMKTEIAVNLGNIGETYSFIAADTAKNIPADSLVRKNRAENLGQAVYYLGLATKKCRELNFFGPLIEFDQFLSKAYAMSGNYENAYDIFTRYIKNRDSVFSEQNNLKIRNLGIRREMELKDKEIVIKSEEIEISRLAVKNQQNERLIYISGIIILFLIISFLTREFVKRSQNHKNTMSDIARLQSHDIRAPVARIMGLSKLFNRKSPADPINAELIDHINAAMHELDEAVRKVVGKTVD